MKRLFAILFTLTLFVSVFVIPVDAESTEINNDFEIIILDEVSSKTEEKIKRHFASGEPLEVDDATTYGLTCTLFGHKLKNTAVTTITHKVSTTSPRCLERTYAYEECTRCDYTNSTLINSIYIVCCS